MAKIDKSLYTKAEWNKLKQERREAKRQAHAKKMQSQKPKSKSEPKTIKRVNTGKKYILCMKHGHKYNSEYVNNLYEMCKRHTTYEFEFVCVTDDKRSLNSEITILDLPPNLQGWWIKPYMFSDELGLDGTILYMDLDVVIANNFDKLWTFAPNHWCVIRDFTRVMRPKWDRYNSSIIRFDHGQLNHVWEKYKVNRRNIERRFFGDQDYLWEADKSAMLWPDKWIQSWKWEIRKSREYKPGGTKGNRKLKFIEDVKPSPECCITVFHGDPNPHNCDDPWVVENWK